MITRLRAFAFTAFICAAFCNAGAQNFSADSTHKPIMAIRPAVIKPKKPKPIAKEWSVGGRLNTDGWSAFVDIGKVQSEDSKLSDRFYNIRLLQFELGEHKHVKETKSTNDYLRGVGGDKPKPFIYGKLNNFYSLKASYGFRKLIAGKPESGTVSIHWVYLGGLSIGFEKPYYLDVYMRQDNPAILTKESVRYEDITKSSFLTKELIIGSSSWSKGLDHLKVIPGLHAKTGLHFDFASSKNRLIALETGIAAELYTKKIELMANQKATPLLLNGYISLQFGKRK